MAAEKEKLSQTMRIDLIPDVPAKPVVGKKKRVTVAAPDRRERPPVSVPVQVREEETGKLSEYQELLQSLYDAAIITNISGKVVDVNVRASEFLLYERSELLNLSIFEVISGTDESLIQTLLGNLQDERYTLIQAYCVRSDAGYFPAEIAVNQLRLSDAPHLCFFIRDITLRRQAEEMLRTEHNAIQNAGNGIAIANLDMCLEYVNPAVIEMWGHDETDDLLGLDVRDLLADKKKAEEMIAAVTGNLQVWSGDINARRKDGSEFDIQISAACNRNSDGETVGAIFSLVDIGDRKRADEAEREAERRRVMLESLGAACHHLGQPATVLLANLGIMKKKLDGSGDALVNELVDGSIKAMETLGEILHKLNTVNEYKTTRYLDTPDGSDAPSNRIIEI